MGEGGGGINARAGIAVDRASEPERGRGEGGREGAAPKEGIIRTVERGGWAQQLPQKGERKGVKGQVNWRLLHWEKLVIINNYISNFCLM